MIHGRQHVAGIDYTVWLLIASGLFIHYLICIYSELKYRLKGKYLDKPDSDAE